MYVRYGLVIFQTLWCPRAAAFLFVDNCMENAQSRISFFSLFFFKSKSRPFSCSTTRLDTNCTHSTRREREKPWNTTKNGVGPTVNGSRIGDEEREEENNVFFSSTRCGCRWNAHTHGNVDANSQAGYDWTRLQDEWVKLERKKEKKGGEGEEETSNPTDACVCLRGGRQGALHNLLFI